MSNLINEVCSKNSSPKNMGGKDQCLEAPVKTFFLAKEGFSFASSTAMKTVAAWNTAIENKDIIPLPNIEGLELDNQEASIKTGRYKDYELKEGVAGVKYRLDLSVCSYDALKSYKDSEYKRIFEVTNEEEVTCDVQDDNTIKGRELASFLIGLRNQATDEDVPFVDVMLKFEEDTYSIISPSFDVSEKEGIFDVIIEQVSASATEIKFTVKALCSNSKVTSLADGNVNVLDGASAHSSTFTVADANGIYTLTGTGFTTGFTVGLNGVVTSGNHYESPERTVITV